jgi:hypothetical protein
MEENDMEDFTAIPSEPRFKLHHLKEMVDRANRASSTVADRRRLPLNQVINEHFIARRLVLRNTVASLLPCSCVIWSLAPDGPDVDT